MRSWAWWLGVLLVSASCALVAYPSLAQADDGGIVNVGGAAHLLRDQGEIRMVAETVTATVGNDRIEVDCVFRFQNLGHADTVLIGFPDRSDDFGYSKPMTSFRSWVDGVEVRCDTMTDADHVDDESWAYYWTKRVHFAAGQTRVIRDHYLSSPGQSFNLEQSFEYILETGESWAGTIGSAEIEVKLEGIKPSWVQYADPPPKIRGNRLLWSFKDFEPGTSDGSPNTIGFSWIDPRVRRDYIKRTQASSH